MAETRMALNQLNAEAQKPYLTMFRRLAEAVALVDGCPTSNSLQAKIISLAPSCSEATYEEFLCTALRELRFRMISLADFGSAWNSVLNEPQKYRDVNRRRALLSEVLQLQCAALDGNVEILATLLHALDVSLADFGRKRTDARITKALCDPVLNACTAQVTHCLDVTKRMKVFERFDIAWHNTELLLQKYSTNSEQPDERLVDGQNKQDSPQDDTKVPSSGTPKSKQTADGSERAAPDAKSGLTVVYKNKSEVKEEDDDLPDNEDCSTCHHCARIQPRIQDQGKEKEKKIRAVLRPIDRVIHNRANTFADGFENVRCCVETFSDCQQYEQAIKFLVFMLQKAERDFRQVALAWKQLTEKMGSTPPQVWYQSDVPIRIALHCNLVHALCNWIMSVHEESGGGNEDEIRPGYRRLIEVRDCSISLRNKVENLVRLQYKVADFYATTQGETFDGSLIKGGASDSSTTVREDVSHAVEPSNSSNYESAGPEDPENDSVTSKVSIYNAPATHLEASAPETSCPHHSALSEAVVDEPQTNTVFDWELASKNPKPSQWDEEDAPSGPSKKDKIKTRPEAAVAVAAAEEDHHVVVTEPRRRASIQLPVQSTTTTSHKWIFKDQTHYDTMRILFPLPGQKDKEGELTWTAFCDAMHSDPLFFEIESKKGAAYSFIRPAMAGMEQMSITLHKPHAKQVVMRNIVWNYRLALHRRFGWEAEDFVLQEEEGGGEVRMRERRRSLG